MMVRIEKSSMDIKIDCFLKTSPAFTPDYRLHTPDSRLPFPPAKSGQMRSYRSKAAKRAMMVWWC
jgi:hypothetical protein